MKAHIKGVIIAIFSGIVILLAINFFISHQFIIEEEVVINQEAKKVFNYLEQPENYAEWMTDLANYSLTKHPKSNYYYFIGADNKKHSLEFLVLNTKNKIQIKYLIDSEHRASFLFEIIPQHDLSLVKFQQVWNVGWNPLSRLMASASEKKLAENLKKDLIVLKKLQEK